MREGKIPQRQHAHILNPLPHRSRLARPLTTYCHCAGDHTVPGVGDREQGTLSLYLPDLLGGHFVIERKTKGHRQIFRESRDRAWSLAAI